MDSKDRQAALSKKGFTEEEIKTIQDYVNNLLEANKTLKEIRK